MLSTQYLPTREIFSGAPSSRDGCGTTKAGIYACLGKQTRSRGFWTGSTGSSLWGTLLPMLTPCTSGCLGQACAPSWRYEWVERVDTQCSVRQGFHTMSLSMTAISEPSWSLGEAIEKGCGALSTMIFALIHTLDSQILPYPQCIYYVLHSGCQSAEEDPLKLAEVGCRHGRTECVRRS